MKILVGMVFAALIAGSPVQAKPTGEALYTQKLCHTCHGTKGAAPIAPSYPVICGQKSKYLFEQSQYIRDGLRKTPQSAVMKGLVAKVTDEEFKKISDFLESACAIK